MADKKVVKSFLWGALTGAVTGAVTALLFAPKSGRELRSDISETAQKIGEKTAEIGRQARTSVQSLARKVSGRNGAAEEDSFEVGEVSDSAEEGQDPSSVQ